MAVQGQWIQTSNGFGNNRWVGSLASSNGWVYAGIFIPLGDNTNLDGVYRSSDNGLTWEAPDPKNGCYLEPYDLYASGSTVYAATDYYLWKSENSGASFSIPDNGNYTSVQNVVPCNGNIISNSGGAIYQSYNADLTEFVPNPIDSTYIKDMVSNASMVVATFNKNNYQQGRVRISSDCGSSWQDVLVINGDRFTALSMSGNSILAKSNVSGVYLSTDMGSNWTIISTINGAFIMSAVVEDGYVFATTNDGVFVSNDNGQSWADISDGLEGVVGDFNAITIHGGYVFMGSSFHSVWRRAMSDITSVATDRDMQFMVYPNPVRDVINLQYQDGEFFQGTYRIQSLTGQKILIGNLVVHSGRARINVSDLIPGLYFLILEHTKGVRVQKKIVVVD